MAHTLETKNEAKLEKAIERGKQNGVDTSELDEVLQEIKRRPRPPDEPALRSHMQPIALIDYLLSDELKRRTFDALHCRPRPSATWSRPAARIGPAVACLRKARTSMLKHTDEKREGRKGRKEGRKEA